MGDQQPPPPPQRQQRRPGGPSATTDQPSDSQTSSGSRSGGYAAGGGYDASALAGAVQRHLGLGTNANAAAAPQSGGSAPGAAAAAAAATTAATQSLLARFANRGAAAPGTATAAPANIPVWPPPAGTAGLGAAGNEAPTPPQRQVAQKPAGGRGTGRGAGGAAAAGSEGSRGRALFPPHLDNAQLQPLLKRGHVLRCKLRVNAANRSEAFCTLDGAPADLMIRGDRAQNRGIDGDEVAVEVLPLSQWFCNYRERDQLVADGRMPSPQECPFQQAKTEEAAALAAGDGGAAARAQRPWFEAGTREGALKILERILRTRTDMRATGRVVAILAPSPKRDAMVGVLLPLDEDSTSSLDQQQSGGQQLVPLDPRLPRCLVTAESLEQLPEDIRTEAFRPNPGARTFVCASLQPWFESQERPFASVRAGLGRAGDIEGGTAALLAASSIRTDDFSDEVLGCLPAVPWRVTEADLVERRDLRSWQIFSIDPITARDLDDALSIELLPPAASDDARGASDNARARWRVGVHIADVASFVRPGTALDKEAMLRGTSTYLVQRVIPMLPRLLCEQLCSLNPGEERFAFSIVWTLDKDGNVLEEWAGRSVILSRAKLAYPMVQQMIEGCFDPTRWGDPPLHAGASWPSITSDCLALHAIARRLRARRFAGGALRLDNTRLYFTLDAEGKPVAAAPYIQQEANQLVEEYMLLANMRVAGIISRAFSDHAVLRCHPFPNERKMKELQLAGRELGLELDISSAGALQRSLALLREAAPDATTAEVVTLLATKPMQLAQYFCTAGRAPDSWGHYALAVPLYTHFTSPIRRYPDVLVHRLLAAALALGSGAEPSPTAALLGQGIPESTEMQRMADHCNDTRKAARDVQDGSLKLFLAVMLKDAPSVSLAVVTGVGGDRFFNAYLPEFGTEARITLSEAGLVGTWDQDTKTATVVEASDADALLRAQQQQGSSGGGSGGGPGFGRSGSNSSTGSGNWRRGGGRGGGGGRPHSGGAQNGEGGNGSGGGAAAADIDTAAWDASLPRLRNPHGLTPLRIPAEIKLFAQVPVVVGAYVSKVSGHPMDIAARVYTAAMAEAAAAGAREAAAASEAAAAALGVAEAERGGLHLGVLVDTMFED